METWGFQTVSSAQGFEGVGLIRVRFKDSRSMADLHETFGLGA